MIKCKPKPSWVKLELEHTKSKRVAQRIAKDHIREFGCGYYPALIKMEQRLKRGK